MLTRAQKEEQVVELREKFARAKGVIVADYRGLSVPAVNVLRNQLRTDGPDDYEYRVTKNAMLRRASEGSPVEAMMTHFEGPTAVAIAYGDPVRLTKILVDYAKEHEVFEIRAGVVDGHPVALEDLKKLASLPSLDELRAKLVGLIAAPATKLVRVLSAPAGQLARVVDARRASLEESAGTN